MPRKAHPGATLTATPNPVLADTPQAIQVEGAGCPPGPINIGFHGETSWVDNVGVVATATVGTDGKFVVLLPDRAYQDNDAFELAEMYLQARAPGTGDAPGAQVPLLIAATILYVKRSSA